jgi:hypothetical protein
LSKSKITATRFYLQNINSDSDIHDSPYKRLFKLTHILSSAHLVAYIDGDNVEFRFMIKQGNNVLFKTIEHSKRKSDFIDFMTKALTIKSSEIQQAVSWIDVVRKEIGNASKNAFYTEIREGILNFNKELKKYISDDDFNRYASFQITNITCHNFDGTNIGLIFFNSNYYPIFNYNQPTANLLKQSYAYDLYNSLNELIENEKESRDKYEQNVIR